MSTTVFGIVALCGLVLLALIVWASRPKKRDDGLDEGERQPPRKSHRVRINAAGAAGGESRRKAPRGGRPAKRSKVRDLEVRPLDPDDAGFFEDEDDEEITVLRVEVDKNRRGSEPPIAKAEVIVADFGAEVDVPTRAEVAVLTSAYADSDPGRKRKRNEDRYLKLDSHYVYAVADGMGGHAGGDVAAQLAIDTLREAFEDHLFEADVQVDGDRHLPWRADELVKAVQRANLAIFRERKAKPWLQDMGTTLVAARFAKRKERVYIAHVGDSRCYRLRDGELKQLTTDHTFRASGVVVDGPTADALSRAVGPDPHLTIDVVVAEPIIGDRYLLCSDGLSRMVDEAMIGGTLSSVEDIQDGADMLINLANDAGGHDNVTVIVVEVCTPGDALRLDERRRAG